MTEQFSPCLWKTVNNIVDNCFETMSGVNKHDEQEKIGEKRMSQLHVKFHKLVVVIFLISLPL